MSFPGQSAPPAEIRYTAVRLALVQVPERP